VDGAFIIIGWVSVKLVLEYLHSAGYVHFEVPKTVLLGLIVVIFLISFWYAREHERKKQTKTGKQAHALLTDDEVK
jgi:predicted tellurium resistance membrane protein TerC